jgi:hypothetical protein
MDRGIVGLGRKALVTTVAMATSFVLLAPAAFAGADLNDDGDAEEERMGIAVVVILLIAIIWFFVYRNRQGDEAGDDI